MTEELKPGDFVQLKVGQRQPTMIIETISHNDNYTCNCVYYDLSKEEYVKKSFHKVVLKKVASED